MSEKGFVSVTTDEGVTTVSFFHPKKNSLPGELLSDMARAVTDQGNNREGRVIVLQSEGDGPFCAGASFDELLAVDSMERGKQFFMGFGRLILAMKRCPKFIIARIHGKVVGGGVGIVATADYALAVQGAAIKLSELALGIGPFIIGPAVERKVGIGAYSAISIDADWRDADWAKAQNLYTELYPDIQSLDAALNALTTRLATYNPEAMAKLKSVFWEGTDHWETLLAERAEISGGLVLSDFTAKAIAAFKQR